MGCKATIVGPAKYMSCAYPFEDIRKSEKRYSEVLSRGGKS